MEVTRAFSKHWTVLLGQTSKIANMPPEPNFGTSILKCERRKNRLDKTGTPSRSVNKQTNKRVPLVFFFSHWYSGEKERSASHRNPHNWRARRAHTTEFRTDGAISLGRSVFRAGYGVTLVNWAFGRLKPQRSATETRAQVQLPENVGRKFSGLDHFVPQLEYQNPMYLVNRNNTLMFLVRLLPFSNLHCWLPS